MSLILLSFLVTIINKSTVRLARGVQVRQYICMPCMEITFSKKLFLSDFNLGKTGHFGTNWHFQLHPFT